MNRVRKLVRKALSQGGGSEKDRPRHRYGDDKLQVVENFSVKAFALDTRQTRVRGWCY